MFSNDPLIYIINGLALVSLLGGSLGIVMMLWLLADKYLKERRIERFLSEKRKYTTLDS